MSSEWETCPHVWVAMLDIKDGVFEAIHAFDSATEAEKYREWIANKTGDTCYIVELPRQSVWDTAGVAA
jgi:hypothetical protein